MAVAAAGDKLCRAAGGFYDKYQLNLSPGDTIIFVKEENRSFLKVVDLRSAPNTVGNP
jgi:hypothetical protein